MAVDEDDGALMRFEIKNSKPIDLLDLTASLSALGEAYRDYADRSGLDRTPGNVRLFVRELRSGSVIADLKSMSDQASFVLDHWDAIAGFATHFTHVIQWLALPLAGVEPPTKKEAAQAVSIVEPIAKDSASQLFLSVGRDLHLHVHLDSPQANAIQNNARRILGPQLPTSKIHRDQLLSLYQVRGDPSSTAGDMGIIEEIAPTPVKLLFLAEDAKDKILNEPYPFEKIFLVDVEAKATEGRVRLYRIIQVKEVLNKD